MAESLNIGMELAKVKLLGFCTITSNGGILLMIQPVAISLGVSQNSSFATEKYAPFFNPNF